MNGRVHCSYSVLKGLTQEAQHFLIKNVLCFMVSLYLCMKAISEINIIILEDSPTGPKHVIIALLIYVSSCVISLFIVYFG